MRTGSSYGENKFRIKILRSEGESQLVTKGIWQDAGTKLKGHRGRLEDL